MAAASVPACARGAARILRNSRVSLRIPGIFLNYIDFYLIHMTGVTKLFALYILCAGALHGSRTPVEGSGGHL